jgi:hypothetical protein
MFMLLNTASKHTISSESRKWENWIATAFSRFACMHNDMLCETLQDFERHS